MIIGFSFSELCPMDLSINLENSSVRIEAHEFLRFLYQLTYLFQSEHDSRTRNEGAFNSFKSQLTWLKLF